MAAAPQPAAWLRPQGGGNSGLTAWLRSVSPSQPSPASPAQPILRDQIFEEFSAIITISAFGLPLSSPAFRGRHFQSPRRRSALNLVPRMWFIRFQNPFHAVIIPLLDTALQTHRYTDMASKRGHSFTATQKSRHGFRDKRTTDFNKNGWGRSHLPPKSAAVVGLPHGGEIGYPKGSVR